ncbi:hypothetical protein Lbir_1687 [Legionella birminghamensis]|uniref:Secreted protein n=1 Tax=Legionella birminghamensis TaxID=28083 RepID=A0A378I6M8_9GAMM|nr:hypothetical protein [Legionella birminghamensis]KTC71535.1 hypothetical protein Lbir_1687 [Legionella birminghamensis]STX30857.1 Uncharacterised protein [Legionella birminghamensis]
MKKCLMLAAASLMVNVHAADRTWCNYKDYFRLSGVTHSDIQIVNAYHDSEIVFIPVGPRSFEIQDGTQCRSGFAHVTVAYDENSWCILDIKDGPLMNHPTVHASCKDIRYIDTSYDGSGSHSYTINFD